MGGREHEHGSSGGRYPPVESSIYPPPPGPYAPYPPIYSQDRAFDAYPPPPPSQFPPPPLEQSHHHGHHEEEHHHHHHHHGHHHHDGHEHHAPPPPYGEFTRAEIPNRCLASGQLVKLHSQANSDYNLAVRYDGVVLAPASHSDPTQHWIKDMSWSTKVRDDKGFPAFALVNQMTNKALKHTGQEMQQVLLTDYNPSVFDESVLWTQSEDMGSGYATLRMATNIKLNMDAYKGDKKSGGIKDGTPVILFKWKKQENQLWKIVPCE